MWSPVHGSSLISCYTKWLPFYLGLSYMWLFYLCNTVTIKTLRRAFLGRIRFSLWTHWEWMHWERAPCCDAARNNGTGANTRLFSAWRHAAFPPCRSEVLPCAPLPAPDSSQPANRLPFLNIDGCIVEQGGHCPVTGENRSKSLAGEGAAYARTGRAAVVRFTTW